MRNIFYFIKSIILLAAFTACSSDNDNQPSGESGILTVNISNYSSHSINYAYSGDIGGELVFDDILIWEYSHNLQSYYGEIVSVGAVGEIVDIGSIPEQGWVSGNIPCKDGYGYIIRIRGQYTSSHAYSETAYMYARVYVEKTLVNNLSIVIGARVKIQYPWKMSGIRNIPDETEPAGKYRWQQLATSNYNSYKDYYRVFAEGDYIYFYDFRADRYNINTNEWVVVTDAIPVESMPYRGANWFFLVREGRIYAGGYEDDLVWSYNSTNDQWEYLTSKDIEDLREATSAIVNGHIYTIIPENSLHYRNLDAPEPAGVYLFDMNDISFTRVGDAYPGSSLPTTKTITVAYDKLIYAMSPGESVLYEFDLTTGIWTNKTDLSYEVTDKTNMFAIPPYIYVYHGDLFYDDANTTIYDPSSNTYVKADIQWPFIGIGASVNTVYDGKLYAAFPKGEFWSMDIR